VALGKLTELLDHPAALIDQGALTEEEASARAAETYESLGRVWLRAGDSKKAVAAFETARRRDPSRASRLALHLAEIHERAGEPRQALSRLDEYLAGRPSGMEAYEMKVRLLTQLGEANQIVPALKAAAESDVHNIALALLLARHYRRAGQLAEATKIYDQLIKDSPGPDVYRGLFGLYKEQGQAGGDAALTLLNKTIAQANPQKPDAERKARPKNELPGNPNRGNAADEAATRGRAMLIVLREDPAIVKLILDAARRTLAARIQLHDMTRPLLGALAERTQQLELAEELYRSCLSPGVVPRDDEHAIYSGLLAVLLREHKYEAVIAVCKQGLEVAVGTNRTIFCLDMSAAYRALGRLDEALTAANQAVDIANPEARLQCQLQRVEVLSAAGRHADAIVACQGLLREYNQSQKNEETKASADQTGRLREIRLELSQAYSAAREHEKSEEQLKLLLEADPDDETANNNLGYQWADRGVNLDDAERMIRKAIKLDREQRGKAIDLESDRESATYVDSLGWVLFRKGDLKGARAELEKATALQGGDDPVIWDHLGDVLFRQGDKDKGATAWRKALSLFEAGSRSNDERYQEIQQKLKQTAP
jgi:tetratricopeptide (TPR) repeat protein